MPTRSDNVERTVYEILEWIVRHAPDVESAQQALADIESIHPEWEPSDHPDLLMWSRTGTWLPTRQGDPNELVAMLGEDPVAAVGHLADFPLRQDADLDEFDRDDALRWLRSAVETRIGIGVEVFDVITGPSAPDDSQFGQQLAQTVLSTWTMAEDDESHDEAIAARLTAIWDTGTAEWTMGSGISGDGIDWLTHAINHWSGNVAKITLRLIDRGYQEAGEDWTGLHGPLKAVMEKMIAGSDLASDLAQVVLAGRAGYLFAVDEQWTCENVLPLLDPRVDIERAMRCWDGYLTTGSASPKMLEMSLLDLYIDMAQYFEQSNTRDGRFYYQHLAAIALFSGINPVKQGWLNQFTAAANVEGRAHWIQAVTSCLSDLPDEAVDAQWDAWMRTYWSNRLKSTPSAMTDAEAGSLANWTVYLKNRFSEAVELACQHRASIEGHPMIAWKLRGRGNQPEATDHLATHPEHVAKLLTHLLSSVSVLPTLAMSSLQHDLSVIVPELLNKLDEDQSTLLSAQAVRLGIQTHTD